MSPKKIDVTVVSETLIRISRNKKVIEVHGTVVQ